MVLAVLLACMLKEYFRRLALSSLGPEIILQCTGLWENLSMRVPPAPRADPSLDAEVLQRERFTRGLRSYHSSPAVAVAMDNPNNFQVSLQDDATTAVLLMLGPKDGE